MMRCEYSLEVILRGTRHQHHVVLSEEQLHACKRGKMGEWEETDVEKK
jgi:hypothetical protein